MAKSGTATQRRGPIGRDGGTASPGPLVTIGIPTWNRVHYLKQTLDSVIAQTYTNLEIVVADNASDDDTPTLVRSYAERDPRIRYFRHDRNIGGVPNFRFVLDQAHGAYFMWLSDDDYVAPTWIEKAVDTLERNEDVVTVASDYSFVDEDSRYLRGWSMEHLRPEIPWKKAQLDFFRYPFTRSPMVLYGVHRTAVLREVGPPRPHRYKAILSGTETPMLARMAVRGRIVALAEPLFFYCEKPKTHDSAAHRDAAGLSRLDVAIVFFLVEAKVAAVALSRGPINLRMRRLMTTIGATARRLTGTAPKLA